jgi:hypothetical protein
MRGYTQPQKLTTTVPQDQESIQQAKRDRRDQEQIHRCDAVGVIAKKGLPALRRRSPTIRTDINGAFGVACEVDAGAFLVLGNGRRQLLWFAATRHPTAERLAQQITEAFPWDGAPTCLVHDNERASVFKRRIRAMGIRDPLHHHCP